MAKSTDVKIGRRADVGNVIIKIEMDVKSDVHCFRDNDVFLQTTNEVMVISLLEGAVRSFP